jgi:acyl-CoA thioester hydrolase
MSTTATLLSSFPVIVRQPVQWGDMDYYRHVNNVVYFRYFENARLECFRQLGWFEYEDQTGIGPILAGTTARFRKPLTFPDTIAIGTRIGEIGTDRFTLDHLIVSETQQAVVTEGTGLIVTFHYGEGHKVPIPADLRQRIAEMASKSA